LDDTAFTTASDDAAALKSRAQKLKTKLEAMYKELTSALDTPAGKAVELTADKVLIKPIDDLLLTIEHLAITLKEIIDTSHYKGVFINYEQLNQNIKA
jgi:hypothetical protein